MEIVQFTHYHPLGHPEWVQQGIANGTMRPFEGIKGYPKGGRPVGRHKAHANVLEIILEGSLHGVTITKDPDRNME